jgi:hypothetical protein
MLSDITLESNGQYMMFKMLYHNILNFIPKPRIYSYQPFIPFHSCNQKMKIIEYNEEEVNEVARLFKTCL